MYNVSAAADGAVEVQKMQRFETRGATHMKSVPDKGLVSRVVEGLWRMQCFEKGCTRNVNARALQFIR
jgi:hypothetical protein